MRDKVVLITGASSGIGAGTAYHFATLGYCLSLTGRSFNGLRKTLKLCQQAGCHAEDILMITADLQDKDIPASIISRTVTKFGRLDILINNAGIAIPKDLVNTTDEDYDTIMNINLKAVFFLTKCAVPHLMKSKGSVVNVSSVTSQRPGVNFVAYRLSKAALDHFTRILALDLADKGVRVNAVNPGAVDTPLYANFGMPEMIEQMASTSHPIGRSGTIKEVTKAIEFLADNDKSSFTTGVTLFVDGGAALVGPL